MNQLEILQRLLTFLEYDGSTEEAFTAAIQEVYALGRREGMEEAAKVADTEFSGKEYHIAARNAGIGIAEAIRARIEQERKGE